MFGSAHLNYVPTFFVMMGTALPAFRLRPESRDRSQWSGFAYGVFSGETSCMDDSQRFPLNTHAHDSNCVQARDSDSQAVAGGLQSLCWGSAAVGGVASAYFSSSLLENMSTREVFSLTAFLPLVIAACAIFIDEKRQAGAMDR